MKNQYTIKEVNQWENETFNYVVQLTEEEAAIVNQKCQELGQGTLTMYKTDYTLKDIVRTNNASGNGYMSFMWTYELQEGALDKWEEFGDCFYKGVGLNKLSN